MPLTKWTPNDKKHTFLAVFLIFGVLSMGFCGCKFELRLNKKMIMPYEPIFK